ncbi:hypothetical protein HQ545_07370 [Candidatus Woesearchaeota archaeon]|nr:hypothetical protein [Candidatus Woesearchaeota archaeon]
MLKRGSRYICMVIVYMLIMPIVDSSLVMADFNTGVRGHDNIPGFRRAFDDITIINASPNGDITPLPHQIKILSDPTRPFDCIKNNVSGDIICEMRIPGDISPGIHTYEIQFFDLDGTPGPFNILSLYADALAPTIHSFSIMRNGSSVQASYAISDRACDACPPDICAGVERIEILLDYVKVGEVFPSHESCTLPANTTLLDIPEKQGTSTKTVCIDAYDRLGHRSSDCMDIDMDFSPPQLINATILSAGVPIKYTTGTPIGGTEVVAYFSDDSGVDLSTVVANFSSLNTRPEFINVYQKIDMSPENKARFITECSNISENVVRCSWKNILMIIPPNTSVNIQFEVSDIHTNKANIRSALSVLFDNTRPIIKDIRSGIADDSGRYWIGKGNNTLFVDIVESGSGFNGKRLFLDVGVLGPQKYANDSILIHPNNCSPSWTCVYDYINVVNDIESGKPVTLTISGESGDDAGNFASGTTKNAFYYDADPPKVINIVNSSICPTAPETIEYIINISERFSGGVTASFSAPELSTEVFPQSVICEESEIRGIWECPISISGLVTYYSEGDVNISLTDRAGNNQVISIHQEVCESTPGTPPNIVRTVEDVNIYPSSGIDRNVASKTPFPVIWQPNPGFITRGGSIQDIKIDSCSVADGSVAEVHMITPMNFYDPLFRMRVSISEENLSVANRSSITESIPISCDISMIIRAGNKVYQEPELETIEFDVPLHNTVLGELNNSILKKLKDIDNRITSKEEEIESLQGWVDFAGWTCSMGEVIMKLMMVLQVMKIVLYLVGWIVYGVLVAVTRDPESSRQTAGTIYYFPCYITDLLSTTFITNLWQIDSNPIYAYQSPGYYFKIFCAFSTCRFTETNNFIELFWHIGRTDAGTYSGSVEGVDYEGERNSLSRNDTGVDVDAGDAWATVAWAGDQKFSAYRSYPIATYSLCGPAKLYGKKKERQILCMYKSCYEDLVSAGFSPEICDRLYAGRQCLYVDGAAYRVVDGAVTQRVFAGIFEWLLNQIPTAGISILMRSMDCGYPQGLSGLVQAYDDDKDNCGGSAYNALFQGLPATLCGGQLMTAMYIDIGDWLDWGDDFRNKYESSLGDTDYCES